MDTLTGDVMCGPESAARNYVGLWMPGWTLASLRYSCVKTTKQHGTHSLYVGRVLNLDVNQDRHLYVREIESSD